MKMSRERLLLANEIGGGFGHVLPWRNTLEKYAAIHEFVGAACSGDNGLHLNAWRGVTQVSAPLPPPARRNYGRGCVMA